MYKEKKLHGVMSTKRISKLKIKIIIQCAKVLGLTLSLVFCKIGLVTATLKGDIWLHWNWFKITNIAFLLGLLLQRVGRNYPQKHKRYFKRRNTYMTT